MIVEHCEIAKKKKKQGQRGNKQVVDKQTVLPDELAHILEVNPRVNAPVSC